MSAVKLPVPALGQFRICHACIVHVATVRDPETGRPTVIELDGMPHRFRCNGSAEGRKARADEQRLAELRAMKARGEAL